MLQIRKSEDRGHVEMGWLDSRHTFSFGHYRDPKFMGFRALRVINEDVVDPGTGFGEHPHADMEIITYVLEGALEHRDSLGNGEVIRPGEVQVMHAGTGIRHSEFNASGEAPVHLLQMWVTPAERGHAPGYQQKAFPRGEGEGPLRLVVSPDGRGGSLAIHQDASLHIGKLNAGEAASLSIGSGRFAWVQVARGAVEANGVRLDAGDGASIGEQDLVEIKAIDAAEVLVYDLA